MLLERVLMSALHSKHFTRLERTYCITLTLPHPIWKCVYNMAVMVTYFTLIFLLLSVTPTHLKYVKHFIVLQLAWYKHGLETTTCRHPQLYQVVTALTLAVSE